MFIETAERKATHSIGPRQRRKTTAECCCFGINSDEPLNKRARHWHSESTLFFFLQSNRDCVCFSSIYIISEDLSWAKCLSLFISRIKNRKEIRWWKRQELHRMACSSKKKINNANNHVVNMQILMDSHSSNIPKQTATFVELFHIHRYFLRVAAVVVIATEMQYLNGVFACYKMCRM